MTMHSSVVHFGSIRGSLQFCLLAVKVSLKPSQSCGLTLSVSVSVLPLALMLSYYPFSNRASLDSCIFLVYRQKATLLCCVKTHRTLYHWLRSARKADNLCSPAFSHVTYVFVFIVVLQEVPLLSRLIALSM